MYSGLTMVMWTLWWETSARRHSKNASVACLEAASIIHRIVQYFITILPRISLPCTSNM